MKNHIRNAVMTDNELYFTHNGKNYLLYYRDQCDGFFLCLECEGSLVWQ